MCAPLSGEGTGGTGNPEEQRHYRDAGEAGEECKKASNQPSSTELHDLHRHTHTHTSSTNTDRGREETHSTTHKQRSYHGDSESEPAIASPLEDTTRQRNTVSEPSSQYTI